MEQLNTYILQSRQQGQSDEQIYQALVSAGWTTEQVNNALGVTQAPDYISLSSRGTVVPGGFDAEASQNANQATSGQGGVANPISEPTQRSSHINSKKPKVLLVLVTSLLVLVLAIGGAYTLFGRGNGHKSVTCSSQSCFQKQFATCSPATLNDGNSTGIYYVINGPKGSGCSITFEYVNNPNPAWKNKPMTCIVNDKESYTKPLFDLANKSNPDSCTGPLVALLESG